MKILKYVFLLLVLGAIALTVFIATQNGTYTLEEQKVINVPKPVLYNYLNEYKNWQNLGLLRGADSTATYTFSDRSSGAGAYMTWNKDDNTGKITTTGVAENDSISQSVVLNDLESKISWNFKDTLNSTKVSIKLTGKLTFTEKAQAFFKGGINNAYEKNLSDGLNNLNAFLVTELRKFDIKVNGEVTKINAFFLGTSAEGSIAEADASAVATFKKLYVFAKQNKIEVKGPPFIIYNAIDKAAKTAKYTYAIQLKEAIYTAAGSEYISGELTGFRALKTTLKGDYSHLPNAWKKADAYIAEKHLHENKTGDYVAVFTKNPMHTNRPSQWITDIYIPTGRSTVNDSVNTPVLPPINNATVAEPIVPVRTTTTAKPATTSAKPAANTVQPGRNTTPKPSTLKPAGTAPQPAGSRTAPATSTRNSAGTAANRASTTPTRTAPNTASGATTRTPSATTTGSPRATTTATQAQGKTVTPKPKRTSTRTTVRNNTDDGLNPPRE